MPKETKDKLTEMLAEWMEIIDAHLADRDTFPLSERPFKALLLFLDCAVVSAGFGDKKVDLTNPIEHMNEEWFSALYGHIVIWYTNKYGKTAMQPSSSDTLASVVIFRGAAFPIEVPKTRSQVEEEGLKAWLCFEDHIVDHECPRDWLTNGPDIEKLEEVDARKITKAILYNANILRHANFQFTFTKKDKETDRFARALLTYIQSAARRVAACSKDEFGMAWYDCQMAIESALKLVIQHNSQTYPQIHDVPKLLIEASAHGVTFDQKRINRWPNHKTLSDHRYGQGHLSSLTDLYEGYLLALDLCHASIKTLEPSFGSGSKFLLERPRYLRESDQLLRT